MLDQAHVTTQRATFLTPVVPVVADLPIHEQPYSPSLLLPLPALSSAIVCDLDFVHACQFGYDGYFDDMVEFPAEGGTASDEFVFTHKQYTYDEVRTFVIEDFTPYDLSLSWRVGFIFGWLSALSKYQPDFAASGLSFLLSLVKRERPHA